MRPITLLNCDYKIIEKCIANRMTPILCEIINENQSGFLPGRRIQTNIRKILDLMNASEEDQVENIVLSCDYMKCFDRIEIESVISAMKYFGFSKYLCDWTRIIYKDFRLKVQHIGNFSAEIIPTCGVHQGGPASNAYFLVIAELLANELRNDRTIKGAFIKDILQFLNQYADDMDVCLQNDQQSLQRVLTHIKNFGGHTGFQLNYDKTTVYRIGSLKTSKAKLYTAENVKWTSEQINVLGVELNNESEQALLQQNYQPLLQKTKQVLKTWRRRNLSLYGRIQIINTLVASLYVYKMAVLPRLPDVYIKQFNNMIEDFIWTGHKPKIPLDVLQLRRECGGLQLVDICSGSLL